MVTSAGVKGFAGFPKPSCGPGCGPGFRPAAVGLARGAARLLSVREVAAHLSVSTATVYKLARTGQLRHLRVANTVRVDPADLEAFIASGRPTP